MIWESSILQILQRGDPLEFPNFPTDFSEAPPRQRWNWCRWDVDHRSPCDLAPESDGGKSRCFSCHRNRRFYHEKWWFNMGLNILKHGFDQSKWWFNMVSHGLSIGHLPKFIKPHDWHISSARIVSQAWFEKDKGKCKSFPYQVPFVSVSYS